MREIISYDFEEATHLWRVQNNVEGSSIQSYKLFETSGFRMFKETTTLIQGVKEVLLAMSLFCYNALVLLTFEIHAGHLASGVKP